MNKKPWYTSKTLWGAVVACVGAVADMFTNGGPTPPNITTLVGALFAIYGRFVATTQIQGPLS